MLDQDFIEYTYDGSTAKGKIVINNNPDDFERDKDYYTLKITASCLSGTDEFEYHITSQNGNIPSLILGGNIDSSNPWGYPFGASWEYVLIGLSAYSMLSGDNFTGTLYSHTGNTFYSNTWVNGQILGAVGYLPVADGDILIEIDADFPILMGEPELGVDTPTLQAYKPTQDLDLITYTYDISNNDDWEHIDEARNTPDAEVKIPQNMTYVIENRLKKNGSLVSTKLYRFQISPGSKIWLVAPPHDSTGQSYNMTLHISNTVANPFKYKGQNDADWTVSHLVISPYQKYYYGTWTDYGTGDLYVTINNTNIPIFRDDTMGDAYRDGLIGEDQAENSGELERRDPTTGDDLESTDIPSVNVKSVGLGVNIWALSHSQIHQIMLKMFDDDQSIITDIQNGTWLWGNNPIDFVISCYWVPFDISNFYKLENERVMLGFYDTGFDYPQVKERGTVTQRISLVNTTIDPIYGDWRDKTFFKYEIYLPYVGFFPLDIMQYQNKKLTVELAFDVTTHNIRYYLFANDKLIDRVDGSVGLDIPLLATDMVNKAKSDLSGLTNILSGVGGMIEGGGKVAQGTAMSGQLPGGLGGENALVTQGTSGVFNGASQAITGVSQIFSYPRQMVVGEISSSMNIYDINYVYLKITQKDAIVPDKLNTLYNWPSYYMGPASVLSGYCELADIRFSSTATENEINEIIGLLKSGVIF